jgi:deoxyribonuclease V
VEGRYAAVDVYYPGGGGACAALVVYRDRAFTHPAQQRVVRLTTVAEYRPGNFYERELPAIRSVLAGTAAVDLLVVDGYVDLDPSGRPGLGAHVHTEFGVPVIGVAKTFFHTATQAVPVVRGSSRRPLYVTAAGLPVPEAAALVAGMDRPDRRLPAALKAVDRLSRA